MSEFDWIEHDEERRALEFLDFAELDANALPRCGDRIGDFALEEELGRGAHGVVFRARQTSLDREVALKLTPLPLDELVPGRQRRSERESHVLASLRHPAIVTVHAAGTSHGLRYVAMDLVEGATLKDVIEGRVADLPKLGDPQWIAFALALLQRLADALAAAHAQGIVHRDIKPANVLIDRAGRPYLADFGLARTDATGDGTWTQGFVGTPRFASPEQVRGAPLDARSDVFSMGVLAYELLTGAPAFGGVTSDELLQAVRLSDPRWPAHATPPRDVRAVVERCLEKRPSERYANGAELRDELDRLLRFEPVLAASRSPIARAYRRALRSPALASAVAALVLVTLGGALAVWVARANHARAERAETDKRAAELDKRLTELERSFVTGELEWMLRELAPVIDGPNPPTRAVRMAADGLAELGRVAEARAMYRRELTLDSRSPAALWTTHEPLDAPLASLPAPVAARDFAAQGRLHGLRKDYRAAESSLTAALRLEPAHFYWLLADAQLLHRLGKESEALALIDNRFAAELPSPIVAHELARLRIDLGLTKKTATELVKMLSNFTTQPLLLADQALALAAGGQLRAAVSQAEAAYKLAPNDPYVVSVLGVIAVKSGDAAGVMAFLQCALEQHADSAEVAVALGTALLEDGQLAEAESIARRACTLDARDGGDAAWRLLADVQHRQGDSDGEAASLAQLIYRNADDFRLIERRIEIERQRGRNDIADYLWQRALGDANDLAPLRRSGGQQMLVQGRLAEAVAILGALHMHTRDADSSMAYASALWRLGDGTRDPRNVAIDVLMRTLRTTAPRDRELWCRLAEYVAGVGTPQDVGVLDEGAPWIQDARFDAWHAVALHRIGRDEDARRSFAHAREIDANYPVALWGEAELLLDDRSSGDEDLARSLDLALQARDIELAHRATEIENRRQAGEADPTVALIERLIERAVERIRAREGAAIAERR